MWTDAARKAAARVRMLHSRHHISPYHPRHHRQRMPKPVGANVTHRPSAARDAEHVSPQRARRKREIERAITPLELASNTHIGAAKLAAEPINGALAVSNALTRHHAQITPNGARFDRTKLNDLSNVGADRLSRRKNAPKPPSSRKSKRKRK